MCFFEQEDNKEFSKLCNDEGIDCWISGVIMATASFLGVVVIAFSCVALSNLF